MIKTRIAPTPSGFIHLGNVLSFSLTAALAAKMNARILLRIDDLDRERVRKAYVQDIFDTLGFLEIPWHEGPACFRDYEREYSQFHRLEQYREALEYLKANDRLFACTCSRSDLLPEGGSYPGTCRHRRIPYDAAGVNWRLRTSPEEVVSVNRLNGGRLSAVLPPAVREFVVRRKNGFPSYQLASLIDDRHYGINLVVRGEDLWDSTLAQLYLASILGDFRNTVFFHHRLLKDPAGKKLSKSTSAVPGEGISVRDLRKQGKKPAEVYSLISSMLRLREPAKNWEALGNALTEDSQWAANCFSEGLG